MCKKLLVTILMVALLPLASVGAQEGEAVPGCDAAATGYFWGDLFPLYEDYVTLRAAFVETGDFGVTGGELIQLREGLESAIEASPACLNGISLQLVMSVGNMQTAILFLILSVQIDDPDLSASLGEIGGHYARRSDSQFQTAAETIAGWQPDPLALAERPPEAA